MFLEIDLLFSMPPQLARYGGCAAYFLFVQAALTGGTLRLERALDEKERELQLQRVEMHGLREHLRAVEAAARRSGSSPGDGSGAEKVPGYTRDLGFGRKLDKYAKYLISGREARLDCCVLSPHRIPTVSSTVVVFSIFFGCRHKLNAFNYPKFCYLSGEPSCARSMYACTSNAFQLSPSSRSEPLHDNTPHRPHHSPPQRTLVPRRSIETKYNMTGLF